MKSGLQRERTRLSLGSDDIAICHQEFDEVYADSGQWLSALRVYRTVYTVARVTCTVAASQLARTDLCR